MKKTLFILFLVAFVSTISAQDTGFKLGFKAGLPLSFNAVKSTDAGIETQTNGASLHFMGGVIADVMWTERYAFTTGILFTGKQANFSIENSVSEKHNLQYVQIPVGLKLFTEDIFDKGRMYFNFGLQPEILVGNTKKEGNFTINGVKSDIVKKFSPLDFGMFLGFGLEYQKGSTPLFLGLGYQRSFLNVVSEMNTNPDNFLSIKQNLVVLELGIKL